MKLNKNFLVHKTGSDTIIVPTADAGFSGVVKGNTTLGVILDYLKEDTTVEKIVDSMVDNYDAPRELIEKDVNETITGLRKIGAIDE